MAYQTVKQVVEIEAFVESSTTSGTYYKVTIKENYFNCTCPDHQKRGQLCKHIREVKEGMGAYG